MSTLREHLYSAYILICMAISMAQRLSDPATRAIGDIATHLVETLSGIPEIPEETYRVSLVIPGIANTWICTTSNIRSAIP